MKKKFILRAVVFAAIVFLALFTVVLLNFAGVKGFTGPKEKPVSGAKGWALGCSAMLMERNHSPHNILAAGEITFLNVQRVKFLLNHWWGVENREDLLETLAWLDEEGGHRRMFNAVGKYVSNMDGEQFESVLAKCGSDMNKKQRLIIAWRYYEMLGEKGILGWDYTRYIAMCRWGYTVGYITEQEAWDRIMPVAFKLQETFDSWAELGENYLIGRQFWSYTHTQDSGELFTAAFSRLKQQKDSPWNRYPWDMNLNSIQD